MEQERFTMRLNERLKRLETEQEGGLKLLPLIVPEDTSDAELVRLRRGGQAVYRSGDLELYNEFV